MKILITAIILFYSTFCVATEHKELKLYYNQKPTQSNINITYQTGITYLSYMLTTLQREQNLTKAELSKECNKSFYQAIFKNTVIEKANIQNSSDRFVEDCKKIVRGMDNGK